MDDEISQEPRRDFRLPPRSRRWVAVVGATGLVVAVVVLGPFRGGGHQAGGPARVPATTASPGPQSSPGSQGAQIQFFAAGPGPAISQFVVAPPLPGGPVEYRQGAPGTVLVSCRSAIPGQQGQGWQQASLHVGPLWFAFSQFLGYVRDGRPPASANRPLPGHPAASTVTSMIVEVAGNSRVVLRPAAGTAPYFHFLMIVGSKAHSLPPGVTGYAFAPCPAGPGGSHGAMTAYLLGFSIQPGRMAAVQVWTTGSTRPTWLTFTAPTVGVSANLGNGVIVGATVSAGG